MNGLIFAGLATLSQGQGRVPVPPAEDSSGRGETVALLMPDRLVPVRPPPPVEKPAPLPEVKAPETAKVGDADQHPVVALAPVNQPRFARTTPDQESTTPPEAGLSGERNTRATSDRPPDPLAAPLPSQAGTPDGLPAPSETPLAATASPSADTTTPATEPPAALKPVALAQGPHPVDLAVPAIPEAARPAPPTPAPPAQPVPAPAKPELPAAKKALLSGSISRNGTAAQNVVDTPLGRYQATINREVETAWLKKCKEYQQYVTAGYETVRFVVEQDGRISLVERLDAVDCGELQMGFTNDSIHGAKLPKMPADLRKQLGNKPLEQILIFYF